MYLFPCVVALRFMTEKKSKIVKKSPKVLRQAQNNKKQQLKRIMAENLPFEDQVSNAAELIHSFVDQFVESNPDVDLLNSSAYDFSTLNDERLTEILTLLKPSELLSDLSFSNLLTEMMNLVSSDNDYNIKEIATLLDLSIYLQKVKVGPDDLELILIVSLIRGSSVDWLLKFWPYFERRSEEISRNPSLHPNRWGYAISILTRFNFKLDTLANSFSPSNDLLRNKILNFTTAIFEDFSRFQINKNFNVNLERIENVAKPAVNRNSQYARFWRLQKFFADPFTLFEGRRNYNTVSSVKTDIESLFNLIRSTEDSKYGPLREQKVSKDGHNTEGYYKRDDLSEAKKDELKKFYDSKDFNPDFYTDEEKFITQLRNDKYLRRTLLTQIYIFCGFFESVSSQATLDRTKIVNGKLVDLENKPLDHKSLGNVRKLKDLQDNMKDYPSDLKFLIEMKREIQHIFKCLDRRWAFANSEIKDYSEANFIEQKLNRFAKFTETYGSFEIDDSFENSLKKISEFKPRTWAKYGTKPISDHWKTTTGLEKLKSDEHQDSEEPDEKIKYIKVRIDGTSDESEKELLNWIGLRKSAKSSLFKFKHVNEATGLPGLFDPELKAKYVAKQKEEEEQRKQEELKKQEEEKIINEKLLKEADEEMERKRKASQEIFDEERKRAKLASAQSNASVELDY